MIGTVSIKSTSKIGKYLGLLNSIGFLILICFTILTIVFKWAHKCFERYTSFNLPNSAYGHHNKLFKNIHQPKKKSSFSSKTQQHQIKNNKLFYIIFFCFHI